MIAVKGYRSPCKRTRTELGVDYICVHTGYDLPSCWKKFFRRPLQPSRALLKMRKLRLQVESNWKHLPEVIKQHPDLVIVGGGITSKEDKNAEAAREMQELIQQEF